MISRVFGLFWSLTVVAFLVYLLFFIQLGQHTLFGHIKRIAGTEEAKELGQEVRQAGERVGDTIRKQVSDGKGEAAQDQPGPTIRDALDKLDRNVRTGLISKEQADKIRATLRAVDQREKKMEGASQEIVDDGSATERGVP